MHRTRPVPPYPSLEGWRGLDWAERARARTRKPAFPLALPSPSLSPTHTQAAPLPSP